ncbi:MAG TPA: arylsulfatase, partial [bacterium]|nr:arylsulfatase [bacterium]
MPMPSMSRRQFLQTMGMGTSLALFPAMGSGDQRNDPTRRPNVLLILTDDQGYGDTGIHGNEQINTPNIDSLAEQGIDFTRFYVEPVCAPTRASLMTGRSYYRTGVIHTSRGGAKMAGDENTIAELLQEAGYATGIFGKWHLGDNYPMRPQDQGFGETLMHRGGGINQTPDKPNSYFDPLLWRNGEKYRGTGYCTDIFFDAAIDFIRRNRQRPFFVYLPTNTPHTPLEISDTYADPYRKMGLPEDTARVYGMIKNIDENVGRLLQHLEQLHLHEETIIVFISDNGPNTDRYNAGLRSRKSGNYEGGIRAVSFFRWDGHWASGQTIDRIAAHIDVAPTLLDICDVRTPPDLHLDGRSLKPLLSGEMPTTAWPDRTLFIQCHRSLTPQQYQNCTAISQRYKLIGYPGTFNEWTFQPSLSDPALGLYDIEKDPGETENLADRYPGILSKLRGEYD